MTGANPPAADPGRVRIRVGNPTRISGAGILIASRDIVTCWHVIAPDDAVPPEITVDFPDAAGTSTLPATVVSAVPIDAAEGGDLALLALPEPAPVRPASLSRRHRGARVRAFGYPGRLSTGVWARAFVNGAVDEQTGWHQLDRADGSVSIDRGFSGAAVFDESHAVIGMVVAMAQWSGHAVAWMIPVDRWGRTLPLTIANGGNPRRHGVELTFAQKHALSQALADVPAMADPASRHRIVHSLPPDVRGSVPSFSVANIELFGIVDAVLQYPHGFDSLYLIVAAFSGASSSAVVRLRDLAIPYGLLEDPV